MHSVKRWRTTIYNKTTNILNVDLTLPFVCSIFQSRRHLQYMQNLLEKKKENRIVSCVISEHILQCGISAM